LRLALTLRRGCSTLNKYEETILAKKQASSGRRSRTSSRGRAGALLRDPGTGGTGRNGRNGRKLGIRLAPILRVLDAGVARLERQLPKFADDAKKSNALLQSIERLKTVRHMTMEICPNEGRWFGVPRDHDDEYNHKDE
jgi:hypothetical protein